MGEIIYYGLIVFNIVVAILVLMLPIYVVMEWLDEHKLPGNTGKVSETDEANHNRS